MVRAKDQCKGKQIHYVFRFIKKERKIVRLHGSQIGPTVAAEAPPNTSAASCVKLATPAAGHASKVKSGTARIDAAQVALFFTWSSGGGAAGSREKARLIRRFCDVFLFCTETDCPLLSTCRAGAKKGGGGVFSHRVGQAVLAVAGHVANVEQQAPKRRQDEPLCRHTPPPPPHATQTSTQKNKCHR
jgi:hypothetical protein